MLIQIILKRYKKLKEVEGTKYAFHIPKEAKLFRIWTIFARIIFGFYCTTDGIMKRVHVFRIGHTYPFSTLEN